MGGLQVVDVGLSPGSGVPTIETRLASALLQHLI
jgi:hypothetical protein